MVRVNVASWESEWSLMAGVTLACLWGGRRPWSKRGWRGQGTKGLSAGLRSLNSLLARSSEGPSRLLREAVYLEKNWDTPGVWEQDKSEAVPIVPATGAEAGNGRSSGHRRRRPVEGTVLA